MTTFELVTDKLGNESLKRTTDDGIISWVPLDENNSDYAEYLRYTAWVEAGNKPEDFWAQNESEI